MGIKNSFHVFFWLANLFILTHRCVWLAFDKLQKAYRLWVVKCNIHKARSNFKVSGEGVFKFSNIDA